MNSFVASQDMIQKAQARRTAIKQYGDVARDPGLFSALQEIDLAKKRDARADQALQIQQGQEQRAQATHDFEMTDAQSSRKEEGILNLVQGLRQARDSGQDLGKAFDSLAETLPNLGVDPKDIPAMRDELLKNPEILDTYYAALTQPGKATAAQTKQQQANDDALANIEKVDRDITQRLDLLEGVGLDESERKNFENVQSSIFGALPTPGKIMHGGFGRWGTWAGSQAADYVVNMEALQSDVRSMAFETLKGGGQITEKESEFAADAIAKLSRSTSVGEYRRELKRLRAYMADLMDTARRRAGGAKVPDNTVMPKQGDYVRTNDGQPVNTNEIYPGMVDPYSGMVFQGLDDKGNQLWSEPGE